MNMFNKNIIIIQINEKCYFQYLRSKFEKKV